jgi:ribosome-associated translation inhibitor RaiA
MQTPLQITLRHAPPSPALEAHVREQVSELETCFDRIVSCRVSIEAPSRHHRHGGLYRVRVDVGVPGNHIVVGRPADEHATHADPYVAIREAFHAARRKLDDYLRRVRGDVKAHTIPARLRVTHLPSDPAMVD